MNPVARFYLQSFIDRMEEFQMEVKELQSRIEGKVTTATDAGYEHLRREIIWNQLMPIRYRHERQSGNRAFQAR